MGRFGSMVYRHLRERVELRIYDQEPDRLADLAESAGLEQVCASDVVILSVPISAVAEVCSRIAPNLNPGCVVVDVCSVKTLPVQWMLSHLPADCEVLGTHPLFGPDSGKDGIAGLKIALCPVRIQPEKYEEIRRFLESLELVVVETSPEEHDRQIALSQAIFHLIAQAMGRLGWGVKPISTPGPEAFYRLVKTVQRDTAQLFLDMERENPFAAECRRLFIQEILKIDSELAAHRGRGSETGSP